MCLRGICHKSRGCGEEFSWGGAFEVCPGAFNYVVSWVSCWVLASGSIAVEGPALTFYDLWHFAP